MKGIWPVLLILAIFIVIISIPLVLAHILIEYLVNYNAGMR